MRFGAQLYPWSRWPDLQSIGSFATEVEALGFDSVVFPEHLVTPLSAEEPPIGRTWPELYVLAAFLAGMTSHLRFVFYATVVPYRHPILQAAQIATLDQVSHGRLTLVAGSGWLREEFDALGVPFAHRGARTDEYLAAMRGLWTHEEFAFEGRHVSFPKVARHPRCFQVPHVPIWIGGIGPRATQRIIEFGTGWGAPIPWPIDKLARQVGRIKRRIAEAGRDPESLRFAAGLSFGEPDRTALTAFSHVGSDVGSEQPNPQRTTEWMAVSAADAIALVERYQRAGFTDLVVSTDWTTPEDYLDKLSWFDQHVIRQIEPA